MKKEIHLTMEQQILVENHLSIVHWTIRESIYVNKAIYGFEYDDLYQEGCILLCHAAATYDSSLAKFSTYAKKVVRNGLITYCRQICDQQKYFTTQALDEHSASIAENSTSTHPDTFTIATNTMETLELLSSSSRNYRGVARQGIEALKLKVQGYGISDIATLCHAPPTYVGAWISRATQKLRKNPAFLSGILY
ncbi:MAG: sigma-70 family RNA polymerase sigma factor [Lachnospiraceae bacterium]|nr:sigma-70 family RNA polymerase sigma factor [uncultured Acetatifactor sp.]MCI8287382.1 sigma-70 family RNA polymerase sigma factor [Lachnospiraceae bacterium]